MAGALEHVRVLDLSTDVAGSFCARLMGDFGADVVKVEPPSGDPCRVLPPLGERGPGGGESAFFAYLNSSKRGIVLDLREEQDRASLRDLVGGADVVVESFSPSYLAELGLGFSSLQALRPGLVMTSITPFGQTGPWAQRPGSDLTAFALSGWALINGAAGGPPLKGSGYQASFVAAVDGFFATLCALVHRDRHGAGQHVDVAALEALTEIFGPRLLAAQHAGIDGPRRERNDFISGPVPCKDGHFSLTLSRAYFWRDAMNELGLPELAQAEQFWGRLGRRAELAALVEPKIAERGKRELFEKLSALRVVSGMVLTTKELYADDHVRERGFFIGVEQPGLGVVAMPGAPFKMSATPFSYRRPAPRLGEHTAEVLAEAASPAGHSARDGALEREPATLREERRAPPGTGPGATALRGPLVGLRAIVLTQAWAGSFCSELLGLMGAEVIQVESRQRLDSWRGGSYAGQVPPLLRDLPQARHAWNTSALYNSVNLNKKCITLDLGRPQGIEIFKRLVPFADIVAENFSPRVMRNFGLDYAALRKIKPDVILVSLSAYGATGPYANIPGIGGTIEPMSGMSALLGYEDGPPQNSGQMYPDPVAGYYGACAALLALRHRDRAGEGQHVDLSMQEANMTFVADALLEFAVNGRVRGRLGNHHPTLAPHDIYPCRDGGWIAIAARDEDEWQRLAAAAGQEWAADPRFAGNADRKANEGLLDEAIAAWTGTREAAEAEALLVAGGVPAARVASAEDVRRNEHLRARGFIAAVEHPETGIRDYAGAPARLNLTPGGAVMPAPLLGEHSWEVLSRFLGMGREEYDRLVEEGITGSDPPPGADVLSAEGRMRTGA